MPRIPHLDKRTFQKKTSVSTALPPAQNKTPNVRSKVYEASRNQDKFWNFGVAINCDYALEDL